MNPYDQAIATTGKEPVEEIATPSSIAEEAGRQQAKMNWFISTVTQEIFADINKKIQEREEQARSLACSYHQHNNPLLIVKLLVESTTLRNIIKDYGTTT